MNNLQQTALETVAGRALTQQEIGQIDVLLDPNNRNDVAIAAILSANRREVISKLVSARGLAEKHPGGPVAAEVTLLKLEGFVAMAEALPNTAENAQTRVIGSLLKRQIGFLNGEGLDFGSVALRGMLDQFATLGILTATEVSDLKLIGTTLAPIDFNVLSRALNTAEGRTNG